MVRFGGRPARERADPQPPAVGQRLAALKARAPLPARRGRPAIRELHREPRGILLTQPSCHSNLTHVFGHVRVQVLELLNPFEYFYWS